MVVDERVTELDGVFDGDELDDTEELTEGVTDTVVEALGLTDTDTVVEGLTLIVGLVVIEPLVEGLAVFVALILVVGLPVSVVV